VSTTKGSNPLEFAKIIRDPVHGYIELDNLAFDLINTGAFRRLRWVNQHGLAHFVYPGATITRMTHSIGVYHIAKQYFESIIKNTKEEILREIFGKDQEENVNREEIRNRYLPILEAAALLHDIGHGPFSHASEPVLTRIYKEQCQNFLKSDLRIGDVKLKTHECITCYIIDKNKEINEVLGTYGLNKRDVISVLVGRNVDGSSKWLDNAQIRVLNYIISSNIDADRLDFVLRDSYFLGVPYGLTDIERIIRVARIEKDRNGNPVLAYDIRGLSAIEHFLFARTHMYRWVFYHHIITLLDSVVLPTAIALSQDRGCLFPKFPDSLDEVAENPYEKYPKDFDVIKALKCTIDNMGNNLYCYTGNQKPKIINSINQCIDGQIIHSKLVESINDRRFLPKSLWKRYEGIVTEISMSIKRVIKDEIFQCVKKLFDENKSRSARRVLRQHDLLFRDRYFVYSKLNSILSDTKKTDELISNIKNSLLNANIHIVPYFATRKVEFYDSKKPIYIFDRGKLEKIHKVSRIAGELTKILKVRMFFVYFMNPSENHREKYLPQKEAEKAYEVVLTALKEYLKNKIIEDILQRAQVKC